MENQEFSGKSSSFLFVNPCLSFLFFSHLATAKSSLDWEKMTNTKRDSSSLNILRKKFSFFSNQVGGRNIKEKELKLL